MSDDNSDIVVLVGSLLSAKAALQGLGATREVLRFACDNAEALAGFCDTLVSLRALGVNERAITQMLEAKL
jgi:hypothetical protein